MKFILPFLFCLAIISCRKEEAQISELLSKSWRMTERTILTPLQGTPLEGTSNNWYSPGGCYTDMIWTYKRNGEFQNESAGSCVPGTADGIDTLRGRWTLINDNKVIKVQYTGSGFENFEFRIVTLTNKLMVVERVERTAVGGNVVLDLLNQYEFRPK